MTRCPLLRTGRAWAARGSMCEVAGWATPTGSSEPLCGRTDTKSPMVHSSMVHVAGGEEGSIHHDDEMPGPGCRGGAPPSSSGEAVRGQGVAHDHTDRGRDRRGRPRPALPGSACLGRWRPHGSTGASVARRLGQLRPRAGRESRCRVHPQGHADRRWSYYVLSRRLNGYLVCRIAPQFEVDQQASASVVADSVQFGVHQAGRYRPREFGIDEFGRRS